MASKPKRRPAKTRAGAGASTRRKSCYFCKDKVEEIDYKNYNQLRRYVSEKGKIRSRRISGACRRHQRQVATAVKRAREMAAFPAPSGRNVAAGLDPEREPCDHLRAVAAPLTRTRT